MLIKSHVLNVDDSLAIKALYENTCSITLGTIRSGMTSDIIYPHSTNEPIDQDES